MENMVLGDLKKNNQFEILVDSDAFVGLMVEFDAHHKRAREVFRRLEEREAHVVTTSFVVAETATVLSNRKGQSLAKTFLNDVIEKGKFPVVFISQDFYKETLKLFKQQTKKGTSVTDCANVIVARKLQIPTIFSFDKVYPQKFGLELAG